MGPNLVGDPIELAAMKGDRTGRHLPGHVHLSLSSLRAVWPIWLCRTSARYVDEEVEIMSVIYVKRLYLFLSVFVHSALCVNFSSPNYLPIYSSIYLSIYLSVYLHIFQSVYLSIHLSLLLSLSHPTPPSPSYSVFLVSCRRRMELGCRIFYGSPRQLWSVETSIGSSAC